MKYDGEENPTIPHWLEEIPNKTRGIDLLGLRNPTQSIGNIFLSGITTVTPSIRYLSYRAWMVWIYAKWGLPNSEKTYKSFVERVESAFALSNLVVDRNMSGIIGSRKGKKIVENGDDNVELINLTANRGYAIYTNASHQLGISEENSSFIPTISKERGEVLAQDFDSKISGTKFYSKFKKDPKTEVLALTDLDELGKIIRVDKLPSSEIDILLQCLFPQDPIEGQVNENYRIASYSLLLEISRSKKRIPYGVDFFRYIISTKSHPVTLLEHVRNGWLMYLMRDMLGVVYEKTFEYIHSIVSEEEPFSIDENLIAQKILSDTEESIEILKELGIISQERSYEKLTFGNLKERIDPLLNSKRLSEGWIRWGGEINEVSIINIAKSYDNVAVLIPITWIIIFNRIQNVLENSQKSELVSLISRTRNHMSFVDSILPPIKKYLENNSPISEVLDYAIHSTIDQHFLIAWERFAADSNNVAMIVREGNTLRKRLDFIAGQTQSRLEQAIGWLRQLRLIDENGITSKGERVLKTNLKILGGIN